MQTQQTAAAIPVAAPCPIAKARAPIPWIHLNAISGMLVMIRCGMKPNPAAISDYLFGYAWALKDAGIIDAFQEELVMRLAQSARRHSGAHGWPTAQGTPSCQPKP